jgi:Tfp pilus assembly major pilin PilA
LEERHAGKRDAVKNNKETKGKKKNEVPQEQQHHITKSRRGHDVSKRDANENVMHMEVESNMSQRNHRNHGKEGRKNRNNYIKPGQKPL